MRQQRVGEPAQRAEGGRGTGCGVEPRGLKTPRFRGRGVGIEEAFVGDPTDDREPPRVRLQARPRGRGNHEDRRRRRQAGDAGVALSDAKAEFPFGESAHAQHEAQLLPGRRVEALIVLKQRADRLPVPQDAGFFVSGAQDVQRAARGQAGRTGESGQVRRARPRREFHAGSAIRPRPGSRRRREGIAVGTGANRCRGGPAVPGGCRPRAAGPCA